MSTAVAGGGAGHTADTGAGGGLGSSGATGAVRAALGRAEVALIVGCIAAIALAVIELFVTTSPGQGKFQHWGDYAMTGDGIPYMLALLTLLPALRTLQQGRDGRRGRAGIVIAGVGAIVLLAIFVHGLVDANSSSIGPAYMLGSFATIVGVALFAAGSWHVGLLPPRLLGLWVFAWLVGSALPVPGPWPVLLAGVYVAMAWLLPKQASSAH